MRVLREVVLAGITKVQAQAGVAFLPRAVAQDGRGAGRRPTNRRNALPGFSAERVPTRTPSQYVAKNAAGHFCG
jgi:hypothetical protein